MNTIIFGITVLLALGILAFSFNRVFKIMKKLKSFKIDQIGKRTGKMLNVAFGQTKILKRPIGILHALVFWGFLVIFIGTLEIMIDGFAGTERFFGNFGQFYNIITASGDIFALIIAFFVFIFILRRTVIHVARYEGVEMKKKSHLDALFALLLIFLLMISLLGMNVFYYILTKNTADFVGSYPVSKFIAGMFHNITPKQAHFWYKFNWWFHIETIFLFANILPYSKHFHVFMSIPNVFLSRLEPLGKMDTMESIKEEVKSMMNPDTAFQDTGDAPAELERFGVLDAADVTWKT